MLFIKKAMEQKQAEISLVKMLDERMAGFEAERTHKVVHISDLSKPKGFCPREFALLDVTKKKPKGQYVSTATRVAFDNGLALHDLCRNKWLEWDVVGNWRCLHCKAITFISKKPKAPCTLCGAKLWKYEEVIVENKENGVQGSLDFLVDFKLGRHIPVECKSMAKDEFDTLKAPLAEHRVRTQLYLLHMSKADDFFQQRCDTRRAIVLYISKGFGKKNESFGKVLPFREFLVERDDDAVSYLYERADPLHRFRKEEGPMPAGICSNSFDKRGKACPVLKECWSGSYPAGK